jgi:hypothetical protein
LNKGEKMNIQQKKYLIDRINQISRIKVTRGKTKEVVFHKLAAIFGRVKKDIGDIILKKIRRDEFSTCYNDYADIKLEPKDYLTNLDEVKLIQKENEQFNVKVFKAEQALLAKVENDVKELTDKIMFGTEEEAYKMLKEFDAKEYK